MAFKQIILGALFLSAMAAAASASPRDDMLAGISRCGAIADDRTFLDCVYGAAQPMRAELGLSPAPQSQTRLVPGNVVTAPSPPPTSAAMARPQPDQRGILSQAFAEGTVVARPQAMKAFTLDSRGYFTATLSNGQVWRQLDDDPNQAHWNKGASNYVATVTTNASGGFNMEVTGEVGLYKVARVR